MQDTRGNDAGSSTLVKKIRRTIREPYLFYQGIQDLLIILIALLWVLSTFANLLKNWFQFFLSKLS
jgi:hypothetical protein